MEAVKKPKGESVFSPYQVKLSCAFMGLGQLFCRQFTKGTLLMLLEIGFILFLVFAGAPAPAAASLAAFFFCLSNFNSKKYQVLFSLADFARKGNTFYKICKKSDSVPQNKDAPVAPTARIFPAE